MTSKPSVTADAVTLLRQEIRTRIEIVRTIEALREQIDCDRICGAWLSCENNLSAVIRCISTMTYRLRVFDNTLCYRRLVQDAVIVVERHILSFGNADDLRDRNRVEYEADNGTLRLGCYGRFVAEDNIRTRDDERYVDEEPLNEEA